MIRFGRKTLGLYESEREGAFTSECPSSTEQASTTKIMIVVLCNESLRSRCLIWAWATTICYHYCDLCPLLDCIGEEGDIMSNIFTNVICITAFKHSTSTPSKIQLLVLHTPKSTIMAHSDRGASLSSRTFIPTLRVRSCHVISTNPKYQIYNRSRNYMKFVS